VSEARSRLRRSLPTAVLEQEGRFEVLVASAWRGVISQSSAYEPKTKTASVSPIEFISYDDSWSCMISMRRDKYEPRVKVYLIVPLQSAFHTIAGLFSTDGMGGVGAHYRNCGPQEQ